MGTPVLPAPGQPMPMQAGEYTPVGRSPLVTRIPASPGRLVQGTLGTPAAGADIKYTIGGGVMWRLVALAFTLQTAAAVANRQVEIQFGFQVAVRVGASAAQAASLTLSYNAVIGVNSYATATGNFVIGLPDRILL